MNKNKSIILAITGASGAIYGLRTLQSLKKLDYHIHLILSPLGAQLITEEMGVSAQAAL